MIANTRFTNWTGPRFAESKNAVIIGNRSSFDVAQYQNDPGRAGMSIIHLLAIPKADIFNGVALDRSNVTIIDEMIALFEESWAYRTALKHYAELEGKAERLDIGDFIYGLHLYPDQSILHLHLHILAGTYDCRKYSTSRHDFKTKDAWEVRNYILSLP
ncbi:hypothetical protein GGR57DRAFT_341035 [Xylariaceae sp. FL1272]|nr:hypothetical protein GGR57DRAFT_341035 [Xylariaceae sp. FL1272]